MMLALLYKQLYSHALIKYPPACVCRKRTPYTSDDVSREGDRGVAIVAFATPFFRFYFIILPKKVLKIFFLCTIGYTNQKFLKPSLDVLTPWSSIHLSTPACVFVKRGHSRNANFGEKNLAQKQLRVYLESKRQTQNQSSLIPTWYSFDPTYL